MQHCSHPVPPACQKHWIHTSCFWQINNALCKCFWSHDLDLLTAIVSVKSSCLLIHVAVKVFSQHPTMCSQETLSSSVFPRGPGRAPMPFIRPLAHSVESQNIGWDGLLKVCFALWENQKCLSHSWQLICLTCFCGDFTTFSDWRKLC